MSDGIWTTEQSTMFHSQDALKNFIENILEDFNVRPTLPARYEKFADGVRTIVAQMVQSALEDVSWPEVHRHYRDKLEEQETLSS